MIINKEEVEKAADEYGYDVYGGTGEGNFRYVADNAFMAGVNFIEEKVQQYIGNIIIENQGLKLYKDNEAKRFKELAVEFVRHIRGNPKKVEDWNLTIFEEGKFVSDDVKHYDNIEELFETFIKERNEKN